MEFHEVRFPTSLSFGSIGGPERKTEIVTLANGFEERNTPWKHSRRRYDAGIGIRSLDDLLELIAFFEARRGQLYGFRWKDWIDFKSGKHFSPITCIDQIIGTGNGYETNFQLQKTYRSGEQTYHRPIKKPVGGTVSVAVDGSRLTENEFSVDSITGIVSLVSSPGVGAQVSAGFEFDVPVRFDTDTIKSSIVSFQAGEIPDIPVVEVCI